MLVLLSTVDKGLSKQIWLSFEVKSYYRKTFKEARGSYSFSAAQNSGLVRNWAFLPIKPKNYCRSYWKAILIRSFTVCVDFTVGKVIPKTLWAFSRTSSCIRDLLHCSQEQITNPKKHCRVKPKWFLDLWKYFECAHIDEFC